METGRNLDRYRFATTLVLPRPVRRSNCRKCAQTPHSRAGSADQTARIWKLQEEYGSECLSVLGGHSEELYCSEWVRGHDNHLLTASGRSVAIWDTATAKKFSETELVSTSVFGATHWNHIAYVPLGESEVECLLACQLHLLAGHACTCR